MSEMTLETFYIINQIPKINRAHWNLPWMSCILKFRSLKISLETLERSFHRGEKTEISREASWDIWNSPFCYGGKRFGWANVIFAAHISYWEVITHILIFCVYCFWSAWLLPCDARAFLLTSFEMQCSSLQLNRGFRLFNVFQSAS